MTMLYVIAAVVCMLAGKDPLWACLFVLWAILDKVSACEDYLKRIYVDMDRNEKQ
jgi:hypothetical protein